MKKINVFVVCAIAVLTFSFALMTGCEVDSADTVIRNVEVDFSGLYTHDDGRVVSQNTGNRITHLDLRQTGDQLQAIDNNGIVFSGTIGDVVNGSGTFVLEGGTTAGQQGTISGTLTQTGDSSAQMQGTWIEPSLFGTVFGEATIPENDAPITTNTVTNVTNASLRIELKELYAETGRPASLWFMKKLLADS